MLLEQAPLVQKVMQTYCSEAAVQPAKEADIVLSAGIISVIDESTDLPPEEKEAVAAAAVLMVFNDDPEKLVEEGVGQSYCPRVEDILRGYYADESGFDIGVKIAQVAQGIVMNELTLAAFESWRETEQSFDDFFERSVDEVRENLIDDTAVLLEQELLPGNLPRLKERYDLAYCRVAQELAAVEKEQAPAFSAPVRPSAPRFRLH